MIFLFILYFYLFDFSKKSTFNKSYPLFKLAGPSCFQGVGQPRCPARARGDHAQQLPRDRSPHVTVRCSHHRTQLGVKIRQSKLMECLRYFRLYLPQTFLRPASSRVANKLKPLQIDSKWNFFEGILQNKRLTWRGSHNILLPSINQSVST